MALNPAYVAASDLQGVFRDKDTGLPLRAGVITFYRDVARTELKNIYMISGTPPNYIYTAIPNPMTLTAAGTYDNGGGTDIVPYYLPQISLTDATIDRYYVTVENSTGVPQFTREAWPPNAFGNEGDTENLNNYVPNGQFLLHNNLPETLVYDAGEIRAAITEIAPGSWTFERPDTSTATDVVTFKRLGTVTSPDATPRYSLHVENTAPSVGDAYKDVRIKFKDVNKFSSNTEQYTFAISGKSNTGGNLQVQLLSYKYFGVGGSSAVTTPIAAFTFTPSFTIQQAAFTFGENTSYTLGEGEDDYVQLVLRFPTQFIFDGEFTDAILTPGNINITGFPQTTTSEFMAEAMPGGQDVPNYDGNDLFLPIVQGKNGYTIDRSSVAKLSLALGAIDTNIDLTCDGTKYETKGYAASGVPYSRLQAKIWDSTNLVPRFGTGADYATALIGIATNNIKLHSNTAGSVTATADGTPSTTFTFSTVATGAATYYTTSYWLVNDKLWLQNNERGAVTVANASTSGFTITELRVGSALLQEITQIQAVAAAALANPGGAAKYFKFYSYHSAAPVEFYVWYQITNETDPTGGGTGIKINLVAGDTAASVAQKTSNVLNGWQVSLITTVAASAIPAGSNWIFNGTGAGYYVWYKKDGAGTDPAVVGRTGIQVDIIAADTNAQVATKTVTAINQKYYAVPDFRGYMFQGIDPNQTIDKDIRFSSVDNITGQVIGTFEYDDNLSHKHIFHETNALGAGNYPINGNSDASDSSTEYSGSYNTRPRNAVVNVFIRY